MSQIVTAKLKFLRIGPRKMRLVADFVRGYKVTTALDRLSLMNKIGARYLLKLLRSAAANAKHNNELEADKLFISKITVDGGPSLKRWMPKAHGRATPVRERTSHIELELDVMPDRKKKKAKAEKK